MGAQGQLLDPTIPYRYFAAAQVFHVVMWALIAGFPSDMAVFAGGSGPPLAALHGLTLGVLTTTAMGASLQMLPVATGTPLRSARVARIASWFFIPGTAVLIWGMVSGEHLAMAAGGVGVSLGLGMVVVLVGDVLWRARAFEPVPLFGLTALAFLLAALALGLALIVDEGHGLLDQRGRIAAVHVIVAGLGFIGMLALGFSHVLVPLFALTQGVPVGEARAVFALCGLGLAAGIVGVGYDLPVAASAGTLLGLAGAALHLRGMRRCLTTGMRTNLGVSGVLMHVGWGFMVAALILGLATAADLVEMDGPRMFVFLALFGWLLTFLLGVLQRILPFLGAMNATGAGTKPPRPSELAPESWLRAHAALHLLALTLVGIGIATEMALPIRIGGIAGLLGAAIYAGFALRVWWLIHGPGRTPIDKERP